MTDLVVSYMVKQGMILNNKFYLLCSKCGKDFGLAEDLEKSDWNFCPCCGDPLFENDERVTT